MTQRGKRWILLSAVLLALAFVSLCVGRYAVAPPDALRALVSPGADARVRNVVCDIRLPRILLSCLTGAALALAGTVFQIVFHHPMASPDLLGTSSGACFGAALALLLGASGTVTALSALSFGLVSVVLCVTLAKRVRQDSQTALILTGIVVGALFSGGTSCVKLLADTDNQLPGITYWLMGSLAGARTRSALFAGIPILAASAVLLGLRFRLNALGLSDEEAAAIGVNVRRLRTAAILCASLLTAVSVSVSGLIGWVGLFVPNLLRRITGGDCRDLVPGSLLTGAIFLLVMDNLARTLLTVEIPIGILTSFVGAPLFLFLICRNSREAER